MVTTQPLPPRKAYRDGDHRLIAGVAAGLAEHLGWPVIWVRVGFVVLAMLNGIGVLLYAGLWIFLPMRNTQDAPRRNPLPILAVGALVIGGLLLFGLLADQPGVEYLLPIAVAGLGAAIIWRQADDEQRRDLIVGAPGWQTWLRIGGGLALVLVGITFFLFDITNPQEALGALLVGLVMTGGVVLLGLPWLRRQWQRTAQERAARIREAERAEVASQVHDSVLQTLTLIRSNATDADAVQRLARAEERRLRTWLYAPAGHPEQNWRAALEAAAARVESQLAATVEVVVVGDAPLTPQLGAAAAAASEAMVNAAKHAGGTISVFSEVEDDQVSVFVRDRGPGFAPDQVPDDRHGVRESIVGRMERNGGSAEIRPTGSGTEIRLFMPREEA